MNAQEIIDIENKYTSGTYAKQPLVIVRGEGAALFDADGVEYLDCSAGHGVANLGHANPKVAEAIYQQAFYAYDGTSPFPLAWVCFQLGMLWGELVPVPEPNRAALWYRRAIAYLPGYVKARVHLAEIYTYQDRTAEAETLLLPALSSRDPEVWWRLADVLTAQGRFEEAETQLEAARCGFEELLDKHLLAFADHGAEFYAGSGNDRRRALELAQVNVANRTTRRAVGQLHAIAATA